MKSLLRKPEEEERDRIVLALDNALDEAQTFGKGDHDEFRELVKHCREMHDILLAAMLRHPSIATDALKVFVRSTGTHPRARNARRGVVNFAALRNWRERAVNGSR